MQDRKRDTDVKTRLLDSVGEGEGALIWENSTERCILPYVKQPTRAGSMQGAQSWCSGATQRDGVGGEGGGGSRMVGPMYTHDWFMLMYGKNHHNIVK